jgi:hypothetical protein
VNVTGTDRFTHLHLIARIFDEKCKSRRSSWWEFPQPPTISYRLGLNILSALFSKPSLYKTPSSSPAYNTRQENFNYEHFNLNIFSVETRRKKFRTERQEAFSEFYMYLIYYIEWVLKRYVKGPSRLPELRHVFFALVTYICILWLFGASRKIERSD